MRTMLAAALLALPVAAEAQDRPQIFPTRDVAVTYQVQNAGQAGEVQMIWTSSPRMMRMNLPQGTGYVVADYQAQRGFMVMEQARAIMDVPMEQAAAYQRNLENARFTRGGTAKIAGIDCTIWRFEADGHNGESCITADGVMLRGSGSAEGQQGRIEAVRVSYGAQDAAQFRRPQGYQTMQMPQGMPQRR